MRALLPGRPHPGPGAGGSFIVQSGSCLYDDTPDQHLVVDWAPRSRRILVAGGGSGHGFKFGGAIGEVIADAIEEKENPLGDLFRLSGRLSQEEVDA